MRKVIAAVLVAGFALVAAQPQGMHQRGERPGNGFGLGKIEMLLEKGKKDFGMTDDQVNKIKTMITEHKKNAIKTEADLKLARVELGEALKEETLNKTKIDGLCDKISGIENKIQKDRLHVFIDAANVLTKEQRAKLKEMKMEGRREWKQDRENSDRHDRDREEED